ncbi:tripartite tricarboxylate transporter permease [Frigidibacter sp. ROC022]|uniref:tripartite tricarboxylate transporter permease n=1 Tax=Frigidibacter sp. ROC022 TaxID=2971796 RepID=UPI00215B2FCD|nr:tripartite tricarboxylate transporter permease [Frigidibacter sp. ROC022]MCR8723171.1 tripartite tricarboxylate transporter permease [Frigidibacter sp. ROC022]
MDFLLQGLPEIASIQVFLMLSLGLVVGILIGSVPGLNVPLAVAIALPITFNVEPIAGLAMLVGIYKGGTYGGSLTAVLINVPGTPAAAATAIDGNELTRQGKAGKALKMSLYASVFAEFVSDIALIAFAVPMAGFALRIGPPESFSLGIFALTLVGVLSQGNMVKGLIAGAMGLFLATFGVDPLSGEFRLTFGSRQLAGGWSFIALVIGVFAIAEALGVMESRVTRTRSKAAPRLDDPDNCLTRDDWRRSLPVIGRSSLIGVFIGAIPGLGSAVSAYLNYGLSRSLSREPERFGKGAIEGVAAAEAGNNAVTSSTFVPLLTLGIPGDVITAIMLGAFIAHGLVPGPALFEQQGAFVAGFFLMILAASVLHLVIGRLGMYAFIQTTRVSNPVLFPAVLVLGVTGIFVSTSSYFDIYVMIGFGVLGYLMNRLGFPIAPLLIGFILSPLIEIGLRQAAIMGRGDMTILLTRPISALFLAFALLTVLVVGWREYAGRRKRTQIQDEEPLT